MRSFYEILHIKRDANQEDILEAYRKRVLEAHPDKGGDSIEFQNIRKGYEILSNPTQRIEYDKWLASKEQAQWKSDNQHSDNVENATYIKKRIYEHIISLLEQYCTNYELYSKIRKIIEHDIEPYKKLNERELNEILAARVVKRSINIIIATKSYTSYENIFSLDNVCNDIIERKKHVHIKVKKQEKSETGSFAKVAFSFIVILGSLLTFMVLTLDKKEEKRNKPLHAMNDSLRVADSIAAVEAAAAEAAEAAVAIKNNPKAVQGNVNDNKRNQEWNNRANSPIGENYKETIYNTGDIPYYEYFGAGEFDKNSLSELKFINYSSTDAVVLLATHQKIIRNVFIENGSTHTIYKIPEGKYIIKIMYGNSWNKEKDNGGNFPKGGFMRNIAFSKSSWNDPFDFTFQETYDGIDYPTYSVTLQKVKNGNLSTQPISQKEFFN